MARVVGHGRGVAAHDAGERLHRLVVGNHAHLFIEGHGVAVQQLELLARPAPTHIQAAVDLVQVKDMRRPAELEHHVIGDIHQRRDAALAAARQAVHHPLRRGGAGVDVADHAAGEAPAQVGRADAHRDAVGNAGDGLGELRLGQRGAGQGRKFARDAIDAQAMRQVRR